MYITNLGGHINDNINMFVLGKNPTKLKKYMKRQTITCKSVIKLSSILRFILFATFILAKSQGWDLDDPPNRLRKEILSSDESINIVVFDRLFVTSLDRLWSLLSYFGSFCFRCCSKRGHKRSRYRGEMEFPDYFYVSMKIFSVWLLAVKTTLF